MAAADDDFAFALAAVRRLLADIRDEVADRRREGGRGEILADHALQVLDAVEQRVDEEEGRYAQLVEQVVAPLRKSDKFDAWLDDAVGHAGDLTSFARERGKALVDLWLEELLCDAHAFALLGPAYLFAFAEIGLSVGWAEPDDEHPSMALRTKLLVDFAERDGWSSFLQERVPRIWAWLRYAADGPSIVRSPLESFAERVCRNSVDRVIELTEESIGAARFGPVEWRENEQRLADLLENDILPVEGENGDPATHAQILLAAWVQVLSTHGNTPEAISKAVAESDYQRFVGKALEMSTALRVWKDLTPT